jgi:hypothetical protein
MSARRLFAQIQRFIQALLMGLQRMADLRSEAQRIFR